MERRQRTKTLRFNDPSDHRRRLIQSSVRIFARQWQLLHAQRCKDCIFFFAGYRLREWTHSTLLFLRFKIIILRRFVFTYVRKLRCVNKVPNVTPWRDTIWRNVTPIWVQQEMIGHSGFVLGQCHLANAYTVCVHTVQSQIYSPTNIPKNFFK